MEAELIPGLPEEVGLECLLRLPPPAHCGARRVSRRWRELIDSPGYSRERRRGGHTRRIACLVQSLPSPVEGQKPAVAYGVTLFDPAAAAGGIWDRLPPIPNYPKGLPLFCGVAGVEGKLVVMGGWDPATWEPVRDVWLYSFAAGEWKRGRDMPEVRSLFAVAATEDGRVYVAGGHDEGKNALKTVAAYDVKRDLWEEVAEMGEGRDECEGVVVGREVWVVSGYGTEAQGGFVGTAEVFDDESRVWRTEEGVWPEGKCPRGCAGVGKDGRVVCLGEEVGLGSAKFAVRVGRRVVVAAAAMGFCVVEEGEEDGSKLDKIEPPPEFSGFVQSGCCVEI